MLFSCITTSRITLTCTCFWKLVLERYRMSSIPKKYTLYSFLQHILSMRSQEFPSLLLSNWTNPCCIWRMREPPVTLNKTLLFYKSLVYVCRRDHREFIQYLEFTSNRARIYNALKEIKLFLFPSFPRSWNELLFPRLFNKIFYLFGEHILKE